MGGAERGRRFVTGMIAVPAAGGLFFGLAGVLLGIGAAWAPLPRRDWSLTGRTVLMLVAIGGIFAGSYLSVLDFSTARGMFCWGLYLGFWPTAVSRLTDPMTPERTRTRRGGCSKHEPGYARAAAS